MFVPDPPPKPGTPSWLRWLIPIATAIPIVWVGILIVQSPVALTFAAPYALPILVLFELYVISAVRPVPQPDPARSGIAVTRRGIVRLGMQGKRFVPWELLEPPTKPQKGDRVTFYVRLSPKAKLGRQPFTLNRVQAAAVFASKFAPRWSTPPGWVSPGAGAASVSGSPLPAGVTIAWPGPPSDPPRLRQVLDPALLELRLPWVMPILIEGMLIVGFAMGFIFQSLLMVLAWAGPLLLAHYPARFVSARVNRFLVGFTLGFAPLGVAVGIDIAAVQLFGFGVIEPPTGILVLSLMSFTVGIGLWSILCLARRRPELIVGPAAIGLTPRTPFG